MPQPYDITPAKWILEGLCCQIFGMTKAQLYHYRASGLFAEGIHFARNPVGRITYCVPAIEQWMAGNP